MQADKRITEEVFADAENSAPSDAKYPKNFLCHYFYFKRNIIKKSATYKTFSSAGKQIYKFPPARNFCKKIKD